MPAIPPSPTLFVKNINGKVKKPELRRQLTALFSTYGKLLDVVATRANGMQGQAFVVFKDLTSSTAAMRGLDGFEFYDKPLSIEYARTKSKATLVREVGPEALFDRELAESKSRLAAQSGSGQGKVTVSRAQAEAQGRERKRAREEAGEASEEDEEEDAKKVKTDDAHTSKAQDGDDDDEEEEDAMEIGDDSEDEDVGPQPPAAAKGSYDPNAPPEPLQGDVANPILLCSELPEETTEESLGILFQQYEGFKSLTVQDEPTRHALVHFGTTEQATMAKSAMDGFKLAAGGERRLQVTFAKRAA